MQLSVASSTPVQTQPTANHLWQTAQQVGCPAALWRLPNTSDKHLIIHLSNILPEVPAELEELPSGFAVSAFANVDARKTLFLRADRHYIFTDPTALANGSVSDEHRDEQNRAAAFQVALHKTNQKQRPQVVLPPFTPASDAADRLAYVTSAAEAVAQMQAGQFRKVVLSRTKVVDFEHEPDVLLIFDRLCAAYPTAFVSVVWLPHLAQTWICASPERLVSQDRQGIFRTISLAGTQSATDEEGRPKRPAYAMWSQKEIEEQALVSRYIIECFKKIRLREYAEEGPKTVIAGNLMHLRSDFSVDTKELNFPQLGTVMLRLLHPTSAVCGMPREAALTFINEHEAHQREFYAGFIGPVNMADESHLFVHIRCLKLEGNRATLYAGAGLTEDSDPNREWLETDMKCQTLLSVCR